MALQPTAAPDQVKSCIMKQRYESEGSAQKARKRNLQIYGALQQIYYCAWCDGYHLTTTARRRF